MIKICNIHNIKYKKNKNKYRCSKCAIEAVSRRRRLIKINAVEYKGGACNSCGYNKCMAALIFHHTNPKEKDFSLAAKGITKSWDEVKKELDKCILLCQNCHSEEHAKIFADNNPELDKRLNTFIVRNKKEIKYCVDCKKEIWGKNKCKECYFKTKPTKINWPEISILKAMVKQSSYSAVGRKLGVSDNAVRKKINK